MERNVSEIINTRLAPHDAIRILIAKAQWWFRVSLQQLFEGSPRLCVVGEARDTNETIILTQLLRPDVLLLAQDLPPSASSVLEHLSNSGSPSRVVILRTTANQHWMDEFVAGSAGRVSICDSESSVVRDTLNDLADRISAESTAATAGLRSSGEAMGIFERPRFGLTRRELQVIGAILEGQTNKDIAATFSISQCTVKHHLTRIFDKLGVSNRLELALFAVNHKLAELPLR
jgi:two-component system, NarL family, nitrate/nitrite response regulator NarL